MRQSVDSIGGAGGEVQGGARAVEICFRGLVLSALVTTYVSQLVEADLPLARKRDGVLRQAAVGELNVG